MVYINSRLGLFRRKIFGGNVALELCCCKSFFALGKGLYPLFEAHSPLFQQFY